jgi:hypothetical protein
MRMIVASSICVIAAGCATSDSQATRSPPIPPDQAEITYFDRDGDSRVDYEVHDFGCCDRNWALVDTDFDGRYDMKVTWGFAVTKQSIDQPVPSEARISPGNPEPTY